jgi:Bacteroidetes VLRF1 release factor
VHTAIELPNESASVCECVCVCARARARVCAPPSVFRSSILFPRKSSRITWRVQGAKRGTPRADGRLFAVWRVLLGSPGRALEGQSPAGDPQPVPQDPKLALLDLRRRSGPWLVLLSSGGHFAGAVFNPNPNPSTSQKAGNPNHDFASAPVPLLAHKTFHRYVVRCAQDPNHPKKTLSINPDLASAPVPLLQGYRSCSLKLRVQVKYKKIFCDQEIF